MVPGRLLNRKKKCKFVCITFFNKLETVSDRFPPALNNYLLIVRVSVLHIFFNITLIPLCEQHSPEY